MTSSFSLLSKPILDLFQIQWAFHWMNLNRIGSHSYLRSQNVVDHLYSHSNASNRAGNDGRSGHDLDLHGHERDAKRALKQSYCILSQSVYSVALSHGSSCSHDPIILSHAIPCHPFSNPPPMPSSSPTVSVSMPEFRYLPVCPDDLSDKPWASCRPVTIFFATRVVREKSSVGSECAQLTNHSVGRPMYYIDEASGGVLRERDSQVMRFHSSHSSRNLWSHWKWIEWNLVCLKR